LEKLLLGVTLKPESTQGWAYSHTVPKNHSKEMSTQTDPGNS